MSPHPPALTRDNGLCGEDGFVLPAVVAILLVVAAVAAGAVKILQARGMTTAISEASLRQQGLADGTVRLVAMSLIVEHARNMPGLGLFENGTPISCPLRDGGLLVIRVQDQAGLIDLNASPRPMMEDAFRALGVPDGVAASLAAEIVDARDPDDVPEPNGAEAPQYRARGLPYGPRNAPFESIDEIDGLPSMTEDIATRLRPAVTVHNPAGGIDFDVTPENIFAGTASKTDLGRHKISSKHQAYSISAVVSDRGGMLTGRRAILSIVGDRIGTGLIAWRSTTDTVPNATQHRACGAIVGAIDPD